MTTQEELKTQLEEKLLQGTLARLREAGRVVEFREKFRAYRQQHRQLQQAHRLLVLEHKELKAKYVKACDVIASLECDIHELAQKRSHFHSED